MTSDSNAAPEQDSERRRTEALARLRQLQRPLPPDFYFDREDANSRSRDGDEASRTEPPPARGD
jgi:hypothetical protein